MYRNDLKPHHASMEIFETESRNGAGVAAVAAVTTQK